MKMRMEFRDRLWNQLDFQYFRSGKTAGNVPKTIIFLRFKKVLEAGVQFDF